MNEFKVCSSCRQSKPVTDFRQKLGTRIGKCKSCMKLDWPVFEGSCNHCGGPFSIRRPRYMGMPKHCSDQCRHDALKTGVEISCKCCGKSFYPWTAKREAAKYCSLECCSADRQGSSSHNWKGGSVSKQHGARLVSIKRDGRKSLHMFAHRLLLERELGRPLAAGERVIHVDHNNDNNDIDNLFICPSMSDVIRRHRGSLPWPTHGNVREYEREGVRVATAQPMRRSEEPAR